MLVDCELVDACDLDVDCDVDGVWYEFDVEALVELEATPEFRGVDEDALMALAMFAALVTFWVELVDELDPPVEFMVRLAALLALVVVYCL